MIKLSKDNEEFTVKSCFEITEKIENMNRDKSVIGLFKALIPVLQLKDKYQILRFEIILGVPQVKMFDPSSTYKFSTFGYHKLKNEFDNLFEYRGTFSNKNTCSILQKLFVFKDQLSIPKTYYSIEKEEKDVYSVLMELFLTVLDTASKNPELLKFLAYLPSTEACHDE